MNDTLLDAVHRYMLVHGDPAGVAQTPIPALVSICSTAVSGLEYAISQPLVCLILQGSKRVTMGRESFVVNAGDSLLITADVPTVSQIIRASDAEPYFSLVLNLDLAVIAEISLELRSNPQAHRTPIQVEPTDAQVADAALRLMRLLEHPAALPILNAQLVREMHYWLLAGRHGPAIRRLGWPHSQVQRVRRAITLLRSDFAKPLPIEVLSATAGMSPSSFYRYFRTTTSLSPLQFQKQLRLIEARRLMTSEGISANTAAFSVGYESVQQFSREYRRMFGSPPARDTEAIRHSVRYAEP